MKKTKRTREPSGFPTKPRSDRFESKLTPEQIREVRGWFQSMSYKEIRQLLKTRFKISASPPALTRFKERYFYIEPQGIFPKLLKLQGELSELQSQLSVIISELQQSGCTGSE